MIPGQDILQMALSTIASQGLRYYRFAGRTPNNVGQDVSLYYPAKVIHGSFQPVPRSLYEQFGLDLQKRYNILYVSKNIQDVSRDVSGDQVAYNGDRFQCESNTDWFSQDGWRGILCVYVGLDNASTTIWGFGNEPPNTYVNFGNGNFIT